MNANPKIPSGVYLLVRQCRNVYELGKIIRKLRGSTKWHSVHRQSTNSEAVCNDNTSSSTSTILDLPRCLGRLQGGRVGRTESAVHFTCFARAVCGRNPEVCGSCVHDDEELLSLTSELDCRKVSYRSDEIHMMRKLISRPSWSRATPGEMVGVSPNNVPILFDSLFSVSVPALEEILICLFESKCPSPGNSPRFTSSLCFARTSAYASRLTGESSLQSAHFLTGSHLFANFLNARFTA